MLDTFCRIYGVPLFAFLVTQYNRQRGLSSHSGMIGSSFQSRMEGDSNIAETPKNYLNKTNAVSLVLSKDAYNVGKKIKVVNA